MQVMVMRVNWNEDRTPEQWEQLAEELRQEARECVRRSQESWDRSDTDGFMSQWASDQTAKEYRVGADLAESHGYVEVDALFDLDGNIASTHHGYSDYGEYWRLNADAAAKNNGKVFFNPSKARKDETRYNNNHKKGFVVGRIKVRGKVMNLSGPNAIQLHFAQVPILSKLVEGDYEVLSTDSYRDEQMEREEGVDA